MSGDLRRKMNSLRRALEPAVVLCRLDPRDTRQLDGVLRVLNATSAEEFTRSELKMMFRAGILGQLATINRQIVGCLLYSLKPTERRVLIIAVDPTFHRRGIGTSLVEFLRRSLAAVPHVMQITALVPETLLPAQLFLRAQGFRCTEIVPSAQGALYAFVLQKPEAAST